MQKIWSYNCFPLHRKEANSASASFVFFNGADISICLMLWVASALLLIGIYLRFVSGKRCLTFYNLMRMILFQPCAMWKNRSLVPC